MSVVNGGDGGGWGGGVTIWDKLPEKNHPNQTYH